MPTGYNVVREALRLLIEGSDEEQVRVFVGQWGAPLKKPRHGWNKVLEEARIKDLHWHDLRHTFASRLVMAGVDLRPLALLLGHRTLQTVMRYSHL